MKNPPVGVLCPNCKSVFVHKHGLSANKKQRYFCNNCGQRFTGGIEPMAGRSLKEEYDLLIQSGWWPSEIFKTYGRLQTTVVEESLWQNGLDLDRLYKADIPNPFLIVYQPENSRPISLASISYLAGDVSITQKDATSLLDYEYQGSFHFYGREAAPVQATIKKIKDLVWHIYENQSGLLSEQIRNVVHKSPSHFKRFKASLLENTKANYHSKYTEEYLDQNKEGAGYTIATWLSYRLKGIARHYAKKYEERIKKDLRQLQSQDLVMRRKSLGGKTAYFWKTKE